MPAYKDEERNTWYCKFNFKDWKGEGKTKLKRGFKTKKDALTWEREFLQVQQANLDMELSAFVEVYFTDKIGRLKERTVMTKRTMIEAKVLPFFGKLKMNEVKSADILKWQNEMMALGYKETYLRMLQNQVTAIFNHAEKYYELKNNPCTSVWMYLITGNRIKTVSRLFVLFIFKNTFTKHQCYLRNQSNFAFLRLKKVLHISMAYQWLMNLGNTGNWE